MMEFYNKHYIRVKDGKVIKGFSDAFETPLETDICINEKGGRHFEIDGVINPPLLNDNMCHIYRYGTKLRKSTDKELDTEYLILNKENKRNMSLTDDALIFDILAEQEYKFCLLELNQGV